MLNSFVSCKGNYNAADDVSVNININVNSDLKREIQNLREETARLTERLNTIENVVFGKFHTCDHLGLAKTYVKYFSRN